MRIADGEAGNRTGIVPQAGRPFGVAANCRILKYALASCAEFVHNCGPGERPGSLPTDCRPHRLFALAADSSPFFLCALLELFLASFQRDSAGWCNQRGDSEIFFQFFRFLARRVERRRTVPRQPDWMRQRGRANFHSLVQPRFCGEPSDQAVRRKSEWNHRRGRAFQLPRVADGSAADRSGRQWQADEFRD